VQLILREEITMNDQLRKILGLLLLSAFATHAWSAANKAPSVSMTAPANPSTFPAGSNITLSATASDSDGTVAKVDFYRGGTTLIGTATTAPYTITWSSVPVGSYSLTAKATDNKGATATSTPAFSVTVVANQPPTVSLTAPISGSVFPAGSNITVSATASDSDGTIASVQFYNGAALLGTVSTAPYNFTWSNVAAGSYGLTAKATDNKGTTTTSSTATITVSDLPLVVITSPLMCGSTYAPNSITIKADAASQQSSIAKVDFFQGTTLLGASTAPPYSYTWANVGAGSYSFTARATDVNGLITTSRPVTYTVVNDVAPTVSITSPAAGAVFVQGGPIAIAANAVDSDGTIAKVDFYADGALIGTASAPPYTLSWNPYAQGTFAITAVATDNLGLTATSAAVQISTVPDAPPTVSITAPAAGSSYKVGTVIPISATATDDGTVTEVDFFANGGTIGRATAPPYSINWTPNAGGNYTITAIALDDGGLQTQSAPVQVTVTMDVNITAPAAGASFKLGSTVPVSATAADGANTVLKIDFYANGTLVGTATSAPYSINWTPSSGGNVTLTAVAKDNAGFVTTSAPIQITVVADAPPTVSVTAPAVGAILRLGQAQIVSANAADSDGTIAKVDFYANGSLIGTSTGAPYSVSWTPSTSGSVALTAKATDNAGLTTTSAAVSVTADATPQVNLASPANGATFVTGQSVSVSASASDNDGTIAKVIFYANGASIGTATAAPFSVTWPGSTTAGTFTFTAIATDNLGLATTSTPVQITVNPPVQAPSITGFAPTSGTVGTQVTINGANLYAGTGVLPTVTFNGTAAVVSYAATDQVKAIVPQGATSGPISVATSASVPTATSADNFLLVQPGSTAATVTITAASAEPAIVSQPYTVTVQVTTASGTPTGTILVGDQNNGCYIDLPATSCTIPGEAAVGEVNLTATYFGDASFATATSPSFAHITNPATPTEMCGLDPNTVPNDPAGFVPINQLSGAVHTPGLTQDITGTGNLNVTITSPAANATIADATIDVSGSFVGPTNTGITINGVVANTFNGKFLASGVPLVAGANTITVTAITLPGATAMTSVTINQGGAATSPLSFTIDGSTPASGFAPRAVAFDLGVGVLPNNASVQTVTIDPLGTGVYTYTATTLAGVPSSFVYSVPGAYTPTLTVTDNHGNTYTAQSTVLILDHAAQRAMLCDVYAYLKDRLNARDATGASNAYQPLARGVYQQAFTALGSNMPNLATMLGTVANGMIGSGYADLTLVRDNANQTRDGFPLRMTRGSDGVWRISEM